MPKEPRGRDDNLPYIEGSDRADAGADVVGPDALTATNLAEFVEQVTYDEEDAVILQRAAEIREDIESRMLYGAKQNAYDRLLGEALKRAEITHLQWNELKMAAMIPASDSDTRVDQRMSMLVADLVERIEREISTGLSGIDMMSGHVADYAYRRAKVDILEQRSLAKRYERQAATDSLTGFIRHAEYEEKLFDVECERLATLPEDRCMIVVDIDLDDFKLQNETHPEGHAGVNRDIIVPIAQNLIAVTRSIDVKCRPGGDELRIIFNDVNLSAKSNDPEAKHAIISNDDGQVPAQAKRLLAKLQGAIEVVKRSSGKPMTGSMAFRIIRSADVKRGITLGQVSAENDRAIHHSKQLGAYSKDVCNITEYKDTLPELKKDFDYYKHLIKKGLNRMFPTEDMTLLDSYIEAMASAMAQRELEQTARAEQ